VGDVTLTPPYTRYSGRGRFKGSIISNTPFGSFLVLIPLLHKFIMKMHDQSVCNMHMNTTNLTSDRPCHESSIRQHGKFLMHLCQKLMTSREMQKCRGMSVALIGIVSTCTTIKVNFFFHCVRFLWSRFKTKTTCLNKIIPKLSHVLLVTSTSD